jgi:hypothetical protein
MTSPATTLELITDYIDDIAPINPTVATRLTEFVVRFATSFLIIFMLCLPFSVRADDTKQKNQKPIAYPHLYSDTIDGKEPCDLSEVEAKWLEEQIAAKTIQLARKSDIERWEKEAKNNIPPYNKMRSDCGRTFLIKEKLVIPHGISPLVAFLVSYTAFFPLVKGDPVIHDLSTGGVYSSRFYVIGKKEKRGMFPHFKPELYQAK